MTTLRNAFGNLSTEAKQDLLLAALNQLLTDQEHVQRNTPPRGLQYARDPQDRMRVLVDNNGAGVSMGNITGMSWGSSGSYPGWYGTGSPNSMDLREQQHELTTQSFRTQRSRWTIT